MLLSSEAESSPSIAEQLKAKGLDQESARGFLAGVGFELVAFWSQSLNRYAISAK